MRPRQRCLFLCHISFILNVPIQRGNGESSLPPLLRLIHLSLFTQRRTEEWEKKRNIPSYPKGNFPHLPKGEKENAIQRRSLHFYAFSTFPLLSLSSGAKIRKLNHKQKIFVQMNKNNHLCTNRFIHGKNSAPGKAPRMGPGIQANPQEQVVTRVYTKPQNVEQIWTRNT